MEGELAKEAKDDRPTSSPNRSAEMPTSSTDLSSADLLRLLSCLEAELQAKDVFIAGLKKCHTSQQLLHQAKYGRLGLHDPFAALQRDSEAAGQSDDALDEASVGRMYGTQLGQLEKLIFVQRRAHVRAKQVLAGAEKRHTRTVRECEEERQRRKFDAGQSDDVCMMLEKERERLKEELEVQKIEQDKLRNELNRLNRLICEEKERRKQIVLCLLQDRRKLAVLFSEERTKVQILQKEKIEKLSPCPTCSSNAKNVGHNSDEALKRLGLELENVKFLLKNEKEENCSLKETLHCQESDLNLIRETILAKSKKINAKNTTGSSLNNYEMVGYGEISGKSTDTRYTTGTISHKGQPPHQDFASRKTSLPSPQPTPAVSPLLRYRPPATHSSPSLQHQRFSSPRPQCAFASQKTFHNAPPLPMADQLLIAPPRRSQSVRTNLGAKLKSPTSEDSPQTPAHSSSIVQGVIRSAIGSESLSNSKKLSTPSTYTQQTCFTQSPFMEAIRGLFGQTTNIVGGIQTNSVEKFSSAAEFCIENSTALARDTAEFSVCATVSHCGTSDELSLTEVSQTLPSSGIPRFPQSVNFLTLNQPAIEAPPKMTIDLQQNSLRLTRSKDKIIGQTLTKMYLPAPPKSEPFSQLTKSLTACSAATAAQSTCLHRLQYSTSNKQQQAMHNRPASNVVGRTMAGLASKVQQKVGYHLKQRSLDQSSSSSTDGSCRSTRV